MATQEERLETVEYGLKQFRTETIKAYDDMALELVMVKGLCEDAVKRLMTLRTATDQQFTEVKQDIHELRTNMEQGFNSVEQRFNHMETLLTQILARLPNP